MILKIFQSCLDCFWSVLIKHDSLILFDPSLISIIFNRNIFTDYQTLVTLIKADFEAVPVHGSDNT